MTCKFNDICRNGKKPARGFFGIRCSTQSAACEEVENLDGIEASPPCYHFGKFMCYVVNTAVAEYAVGKVVSFFEKSVGFVGFESAVFGGILAHKSAEGVGGFTRKSFSVADVSDRKSVV